MKLKSLLNIDSAIVFLLMFLSGSFVVSNDIISSFATIALWVLTLILCILRGRFNEKNIVAVAIVLSFILLLSGAINGELSIATFNYIFSIITALFVTRAMNFHTFASTYVRIIKILCFISIVGYAATYLYPSIYSHALVVNTAGHEFSNYWLYVVGLPLSLLNRNFGMYWEPGAFATFVGLGFLLDTYFLKNSKPLHILIYIVTIITTFSTTGIIALIMMLLFLVFGNNVMRGSSRYLMLGFIIIIAIFAVLNPDLFYASSGESAFGKFQYYQSGDDTGTVAIRLYAIEYGIKGFLQNPIVGCGVNGLTELSMKYTHGHNVCTFINWFAFFGFFFGAIMISGIYKFSKKIARNKALVTLFIFMMFFIITISENFATNAVFYLIAFYGFSQYKLQTQITEDTNKVMRLKERRYGK